MHKIDPPRVIWLSRRTMVDFFQRSTYLPRRSDHELRRICQIGKSIYIDLSYRFVRSRLPDRNGKGTRGGQMQSDKFI